MTESHHHYRPILPRTLYTELVDDAKKPDANAVSDYYNRYLAKNQTETGAVWTAAEILWHEKGAHIIRIDPRTAMYLAASAVPLETVLPPLPEQECLPICYEFPRSPKISFDGTDLTAMLVVPSENQLVVWQGSGNKNHGEVLEPGQLCQQANGRIDFMKNLGHEEPTYDIVAELAVRRMSIIAYHLCHGLDWFANYALEQVSIEPDARAGSAAWSGDPMC